jgi:hypothetical protein
VSEGFFWGHNAHWQPQQGFHLKQGQVGSSIRSLGLHLLRLLPDRSSLIVQDASTGHEVVAGQHRCLLALGCGFIQMKRVSTTRKVVRSIAKESPPDTSGPMKILGAAVSTRPQLRPPSA